MARAAVAELAVDGEVVVEHAAFDERLELRAHFRHVEAGDVAQLHERVGADVAPAARSACSLRVYPPRCLLESGVLDLGGEPALDVVAVHPAHVAEQPAAHDVAGQAAGPVADVGVRHGERHAQPAGGLHQVGGLLERQAQRLLAEHRDAGLHRLHRRVVVHVVRRDDEDVVQLLRVGQRRVGGDHLVVRAVALDRVRPLRGLLERDLRVREEGARDDAAGAVEVNRLLVRVDDERAAPAAHQTDVERSVRHRFSLARDLTLPDFIGRSTADRDGTGTEGRVRILLRVLALRCDHRGGSLRATPCD